MGRGRKENAHMPWRPEGKLRNTPYAGLGFADSARLDGQQPQESSGTGFPSAAIINMPSCLTFYVVSCYGTQVLKLVRQTLYSLSYLSAQPKPGASTST